MILLFALLLVNIATLAEGATMGYFGYALVLSFAAIWLATFINFRRRKEPGVML